MELNKTFSPGNDLFDLGDDVSAIMLTDSADLPLALEVRGFKRVVSIADVNFSGGALAATDVWWHLCCDDCSVMPVADQRIAAADGTRWQILMPPQMQAGNTRWKCACREL